MAQGIPLRAARAEQLGRAAIEAIAFEGVRLELEPTLLAAVERSRAEAVAVLERSGPVYGVSTGQGFLADRALSDEEVEHHQANLLLGRAVGSAPWLPEAEARALLAIRLRRFLNGPAAVSAALCAFIADRLNDRFTPAVPRTAIGCAGEVIPLCHAFQTLLGIGRVLDGAGGTRDAAAALAERAVTPYRPQAKEGIAMLAGSPGTTALALARARDCAGLLRQLTLGAACAIDAANVPLDAVGPEIADLAGDPLLGRATGRLGELLRGSHPDRRASQGPISFRIAPQLLAHLERALERFDEDLDRTIGASDDSPAFVGGRFVSTGAFHEIELAAGMDALAAALARAADAAVQRTHRLLDGRVTGLPDQLTPVPGPRCGLVVLHKRAVGALNELRRLAAPASVGLIDTSLGQEDAQTFGFEAGEKLRRACDLTREIVAIELITSRQAWSLRGRPPAEGLTATAAALEELVPPVDADRPLGDDVDRVLGLLHTDR